MEKRGEVNEDKYTELTEKWNLKISKTPSSEISELLPLFYPANQKRDRYIKEVFDSLEFDVADVETLSDCKEQLYSAISCLHGSTVKVKSMKLKRDVSDTRKEVILTVEKFMSKINILLLSLVRTKQIPESLYVDVFMSFLDIFGILGIPGEVFNRKILLAGEIYSQHPGYYLLPQNTADLCLNTIGILSYSTKNLQKSSSKEKIDKESTKASSPKSTLKESSNGNNVDSIAQTPSTPSSIHEKAQPETCKTPNPVRKSDCIMRERVSPLDQSVNAGSTSDTYGMYCHIRKRTVEGRIKLPAVKLSHPNGVINKIPIIITLAPDETVTEGSSESTKTQQEESSSQFVGRSIDSSFRAPGRKLNIPKRLFSGVRSAMEQEFPSFLRQTPKPGFSKGPLPIIVSTPEATEADIKRKKMISESTENNKKENIQLNVSDGTMSYSSAQNEIACKYSEPIDSGECSKSISVHQRQIKDTKNENQDVTLCNSVSLLEDDSSHNGTVKKESIFSRVSDIRQYDNTTINDMPRSEQIRNSAGNNKNTSSRVAGNHVINYANIFEPNECLYNKMNSENILQTQSNCQISSSNSDICLHDFVLRHENCENVSTQYQNNKMCIFEKTKKQRYRKKRKRYRKRPNQVDITCVQNANCIQHNNNHSQKHKNEKRRKQLHKIKTEKNQGKERVSSDSGVAELNFHGKFDGVHVCVSSSSFPQNYIEESNTVLSNSGGPDKPVFTATTQNSVYSVKLNSEFISVQDEWKCNKFKIDNTDAEDCVHTHQSKQKTYARMKTVEWLLQQPLCVPDTCEAFTMLDNSPKNIDVGEYPDQLLTNDYTTDFVNYVVDTNYNATKPLYTHIPDEFVRSLLLEWPHTRTKPVSVGFILHKTRVVVVSLEMCHDHFEHLTIDGVVITDDVAVVRYSSPFDLLNIKDRTCLYKILSRIGTD
ncbi:uncharacterized protein LOC127728798 [Mytilus californianus]|uniref:uncharacterized protein LOC127728798 n=1 Tax=Mytilus californianus TaxID=6549 RepID=UPI0022460F83|nr:uncharacterized protein LOC127728798 [Mytilus californianus]